jgi:Xaa-Pro dipeptidase
MNAEEIENHKIANKKLDLIKEKTARFIRKNINQISERDTCKFILSEMRKEKMVTDKIGPIHFVVANEHTDDTHWNIPIKKPKTIGKNNLIMVDIWARLDKSHSPFADITWMFYSGKKIPKRINETFKKVISARNVALNFIRRELKGKKFPKSKNVDKEVRNYLKKFKLEKFFTHKTGHSLGFASCQGKYFKLSKNDTRRIKPNIPFTIEPGLYFKGDFGIRCELDCYITDNYELVITSSVQKEITKI